MTYYVQVDKNNIITDVITYPVTGYIEYQTEYPLPNGIYGGWWKFENGQPVEYPELKPPTQEELDRQRIDLLEQAIAELSMLMAGGMM